MKLAVILLAAAATVSGFRVAPETPELAAGDGKANPKFAVEVRYITFWIPRHACNAALIGPEWVVAPAKCVQGLPMFSTLEVVVGDKRILTPNTIVHENADGISNDIALIRLSTPVAYTDKVRPINLPFINAIFTGSATLFLRRNAENYESPVINIKRTADCTGASGPLGAGNICAGDATTPAVQGDEGSPLTVSDGLDGQVLIGLLSFAKDQPAPAVYTRVSFYTEWILDKLMKA